MLLKACVLSSKIIKSDIYKTATEICEIFAAHQFEAYIVGGTVRDFILFPSLIPSDVDIATNARVEDIEKLFPNCAKVGKSFGVCIVKYKKFSFEVATFRKESIYLDRRHPSAVHEGTLEEDSNRRDFTLNALYYSPIHFNIIDFHHGLKDIQNRIIRSVGNADTRIYEDSLRILRSLRFSANFKFKIHSSVLRANKKHKDGLKYIPKERILDEIEKVCRLPEFVEKFYSYLDISLFFKNLKKKSKVQILNSSLSKVSFSHLKFSKKSIFFDFFVIIFKYYECINWENLKQEIRAFPCTAYDKKLCIWFLKVLEVSFQSKNEKEFFAALIQIEHIESAPNMKFFSVLNKMILNRNNKKILVSYAKKFGTFKKAEIVQKLVTDGVSKVQFSEYILSAYFSYINLK